MANLELQCYNKSCGAKYNPDQNTEKSCQYHPGVPVFHDALKGWSCCKKRTTDFTDFLKIPGCTVGFHSDKKPVQELKPKVESSKDMPDSPQVKGNLPSSLFLPTPPPKLIQKDDKSRPSVTEPLRSLAVKLASSYNKQKVSEVKDTTDDDTIKLGTKCRHGGCDAAFSNGPDDKSSCLHHPGTAVFHEGMKYWSCCKRKTSDFTSFLNQAGCTKGSHVWRKPAEAKVTCRYDHHQTGQNVIVTIFAKLCNADSSLFQANQAYLKASLDFEGNKHFELNMRLYGVIDPDRSKVTVFGTKVEIALRKARAETWKNLGEVDDLRDENEKIKEELKEIRKDVNEDSEGSDLDGIDDVIFD